MHDVAPQPAPGAGGAPPVLLAEGLRKRYGEREVVAGLDMTLARGECLGLLGPNGAGKTTTLRMLLGSTAPDSGRIEILGIAVPAAAREARMRIGVVPQMDNLDPDFTVSENLIVYGRYFGLQDATVRARVPELLEFAGLAGRATDRIQTLSGGMKRRLVLARALVNDPELILMDEPTAGLDPAARHVLWERLRMLLRQGKTILLTTHFMDEAERLCDRLMVIDRGSQLVAGKPRELIAREIEPYVIEVYGERACAWHAAHGARLALRSEAVGETVFCYAADPHAVVAALQQESDLRFMQRPANLEDVFLKLTGREMRD